MPIPEHLREELLGETSTPESAPNSDSATLKVGDTVQPSDRENYGKVVRDAGNGRYDVHFVNPVTGAQRTKSFHRDDLTLIPAARTMGATTPCETVDPIPFADPDVPPIPRTILTGWTAEFAEAVTESLQTPYELAFVNVLGAVSTAIRGKFEVVVKPGYVEPTNLYAIAPAEPSERKSAVLSVCSQPLEEWERNQARELEPVIKEIVSRVKTAETIIQAKRKKAAQAKSATEQAKLTEEIVEAERNLPTIPSIPRLLVDDVTPERCAGLMDENEERIAILSAEGGLFETLAGRYSNGVPNFDLFLKGYSRDPVRVDRKNGPPIHMSAPEIVFCLSPQPEVVQSLADKPGFRGRGLLSRFLYILSHSRVGNRDVNPPSISQHVLDGYRERVLSILEIPSAQNLFGESVPYQLKLSSEAFRIWLEFAQNVEHDLKDGGFFQHLKDWAGKLPGNVARVAGILHVIDHAGGKIPMDIAGDTMSRAIECGTALAGHAAAAFELMGADPDIEVARYILAWIQRSKTEDFSARDAHRAVSGRYQKMQQVSPGLNVLSDRGFIFPIHSDQAKGPGRPASMKYMVNPKTLVE